MGDNRTSIDRCTYRARLARELSGLSVGQAARLLDVPRQELIEIEEVESKFAVIDHGKLADLYGVNVEWLTGERALYDYAAIDRIPGGREMPFRDRDMLAELFASLPRRAVR